MRDSDSKSTSHTKRSRAALVLDVIGAIEAVVIGLLLMTRTPEAERLPSADARTIGASPAAPAFEGPRSQRENGSSVGGARLPSAQRDPGAAPQA